MRTTTLIALAWAAALAVAPIAGAGPSRDARPERVPPMRMQYFKPERYRESAAEWKRYAETHPRDGEAWSQLARASYYAGEPCERVREYARRAVKESPRSAEALAALGRFAWATYCDGGNQEPTESIRLLERALEIDPLVDDAHYHLWVMLSWVGRREEADRHLRTLLDNGRMPEPLVDYGYNLLVGLEPNAVLVTNGDNDTYPVLALQTARRFRTDVTVVNLGLLNLLWYRRELASGPRAIPVPLLEHDEFARGGPEAIQKLLENLAAEGWKRPVYLAVTVDCTRLKLDRQLSLEGVVYRLKPRPGEMLVDAKTLTANLEGRYRLESATSPAVDWEQWSALRTLVTNYAAADWQLARALAKSGATTRSRAVMERLLGFCEYHHADEPARDFVRAWEHWDPKAPRLAHWRKRFTS